MKKCRPCIVETLFEPYLQTPTLTYPVREGSVVETEGFLALR